MNEFTTLHAWLFSLTVAGIIALICIESKAAHYLWYIIRHKWYVFIASCVLGVPGLGFVHDLSKFRRREWKAYRQKFYPTVRDQAYLHEYEVKAAFDVARNHHYKHNPHHWEYWIIPRPVKPIVLDMPDCYVREMVADWAGMGRACSGTWDAGDWYEKNRGRMELTVTTEIAIHKYMKKMAWWNTVCF